jgi:hypothetical protein
VAYRTQVIARCNPERDSFALRTAGLSTDYLTLAARLNSMGRSSELPDLLAVLMHTVEAEISRARVVEGQLIDEIGRGK